jgi:NAD(P)-dependent dehydrogenase (short-subunit alcohol dehydrogenase family)
MEKTMMVTGGGRGIGAATALLAAQLGYDVCINYAANAQRADAVAEQVRSAGRRAMTFRADVSKENEVEAMFAAFDSFFGPLGVLVNSAGISSPSGRVEALSGSDLRQMFATNVEGVFLCCREAIRRMSTRHKGVGGAIVNLSSAAARLGGAGRNVHYAASKGAIDAMTFGLAQEVASEGIRVNAVSPGVIDTEMQDPKRLADIVSRLPMGRAGEATEVAAAILWLVGDQATYVSGAVLNVSGAR